jgi:hypothetical protein
MLSSSDDIVEFDLATKPQLEFLSSATTLSAVELEVFPSLVQAQIFANLMSPALWEWRDVIPKRSGSPTRRKVEGIKQHIIHNYSFTHVRGRPGLDLFGTTKLAEELKRFPPSKKTASVFKVLRDVFGEGERTTLSELLGVEDIRAHYELSHFPPDAMPIWGNEVLDKMDAYKRLPPERMGSGKCEALAALYASALVAVGRFPIESVFLLFTSSHVMTFLMQGKGYISSNKRMFSAVSLRNENDNTRVVRSCLESGEITRVLNFAGWADVLEPEVSIPPQILERYYRDLESYSMAAGWLGLRLPQFEGKRFVRPLPVPANPQGAHEWRDYVQNMAKELPGSAYDAARYAYREIDVAYPEAYAYAARNRNPHARDVAEKMATTSACIDYARAEVSRKESLFGNGRLALPDETLTLGSSGHRDRALLLYALLGHVSREPYVVFGERNSYVWHDSHLIPVSFKDTSERLVSVFNASSHGTFLGNDLTIGDLISYLT